MALWSDEDVRARELKASRPPRAGSVALKLLSIAAVLVLVALVAGTVYGLASGSRQRKLAREAESAQVEAELKGRTAFTGVGTVRARSADAASPAVVVATIAFPYDSLDRPFAEELGRKAPVLKAAAVSVLSAKKAAELAPAFEGALKAALRDAFNARLSLGKVTELWLSDFAVIQ
jgi:flagellar basal body-associated protein FliL